MSSATPIKIDASAEALEQTADIFTPHSKAHLDRVLPSAARSPLQKIHDPETKQGAIRDKIYAETVANLPSLSGKCIAITGTTSGTGFWTAITAARSGTRLLMLLNRDSSRAELCERQIKAAAVEGGSPDTEVVTVSCDLMSFASVRAAAAKVTELVTPLSGLDVLGNNAGIMMFKDTRTVDGFDVQMQTNHLSHFLLTKLLMPQLEAASEARGDARVIQHSSAARFFYGGHLKQKYFQKCAAGTLGGNGLMWLPLQFAPTNPNLVRYHHTKLANSCFAIALHEQLAARGSKVKSLVAEPGLATTSLGLNLVNENKLKTSTEGIFGILFGVICQSAADGACPFITAAFASGSESGDFWTPSQRKCIAWVLNMQWDPVDRIDFTGPPERKFAAGRVVKGKERYTSNPDSLKGVIAWSEEAIGAPLFS